MRFPPSPNTVRVRMVDTTTVMTVRAECLIQPVEPDHDHLLGLTTVAFLIDHEPSGQRMMFDLGCRKDYWNLPPSVLQVFGGAIPGLRVDKDTSEILSESGIDLDSITSVIWSHYHWDHVSNCALFPTSTSIIVGPGFKSSPHLLPGYPEHPTSHVSSSDFANRTLIEIDFDATPLTIGGFRAYDVFRDGSFYLLDAPGHCTGHICGLARTTASSTDEDANTFIVLGGDICHFVGTFRPNSAAAATPATTSIPLANPCPCSLSSDQQHPPPSPDSLSPNYTLSTSPTLTSYSNPAIAQHSLNLVRHLDADPRVMVCIAHDSSLLRILPTLNADPTKHLNDWRAKGWKEECYWGWMGEVPRAKGREMELVVKGFWREGRRWDFERWRER